MRKLEILSRYLPYNLQVQCLLEDNTQAKGELVAMGLDDWATCVVKVKNRSVYDIDAEDCKPVLYDYNAFWTKQVEVNGKSVFLYQKFVSDISDGLEVGNPVIDELTHNLSIPIGGNGEEEYFKYAISKTFTVSIIHKRDGEVRCSTPSNSFRYYEWFIKNHFAIGLKEDEYIKK